MGRKILIGILGFFAAVKTLVFIALLMDPQEILKVLPGSTPTWVAVDIALLGIAIYLLVKKNKYGIWIGIAFLIASFVV